ncbi:E3 ubiquitin-protein ligase MIB2-like [Octopus sinensis]|uniref:E3 ubiquitin-protein ligase MIB2-like n=1 Tax=Octopus sinensis TaxID=2607531 RepID=A0A7E6EIF4_9MOLL|nr:E3 ubiquitin-protein ligase MIB2-like [Octopus sinensis]
MAACERGNKKLITLLIESGADLNISDEDKKWTALHYAVEKKGWTAVHLACKYGQINIVELLLQQNGSDICAVTKHGSTLLHIASAHGRMEVVDFLLQQNGIDANKVNKEGDTPLHWAVQNQHYHMVASMLAQDSVKLDIENNDKRTPLLDAVSEAHIGIVHKLTTCGANMNAVDKDGNNCLHIAAEKEEFRSEKEHITILDECCAKLGLPIEKRLSCVGVTCYLAHQGANLYRKNNKNVAPLDLIEDADLKEKFKVLFPPPQ